MTIEVEQNRHDHPKTITITVNNRAVEMPDRAATGVGIKQAAGVPADFQLFREHGQHLDSVGDDESVKLHEGERFRAVSGQDVS
jgi:hypothetical protein